MYSADLYWALIYFKNSSYHGNKVISLFVKLNTLLLEYRSRESASCLKCRIARLRILEEFSVLWGCCRVMGGKELLEGRDCSYFTGVSQTCGVWFVKSACKVGGKDEGCFWWVRSLPSYTWNTLRWDVYILPACVCLVSQVFNLFI